jgi:hypothetical protein
MNITDYIEFKKNHKQYSRKVAINLHTHGFTQVIEWEIDKGDNWKLEVDKMVETYKTFQYNGKHPTEFIYYKGKDYYGYPMVTLFAGVFNTQ